mmetsp:Transcript_31357/g.57535  ORF Transcript_31357/g.57535 Transcript_31357/m.57535 type:complete len:971 (-) Transcript_31357:16-2928(-)
MECAGILQGISKSTGQREDRLWVLYREQLESHLPGADLEQKPEPRGRIYLADVEEVVMKEDGFKVKVMGRIVAVLYRNESDRVLWEACLRANHHLASKLRDNSGKNLSTRGRSPSGQLDTTGKPASPKSPAKSASEAHSIELYKGELGFGQRGPRFFVLYSDRLCYWLAQRFQENGDVPRGQILMSEIEHSFTFGESSFEFEVGGRSVILASQPADHKKWEEAFQQALGRSAADAGAAVDGTQQDAEPIASAADGAKERSKPEGLSALADDPHVEEEPVQRSPSLLSRLRKNLPSPWKWAKKQAERLSPKSRRTQAMLPPSSPRDSALKSGALACDGLVGEAAIRQCVLYQDHMDFFDEEQGDGQPSESIPTQDIEGIDILPDGFALRIGNRRLKFSTLDSADNQAWLTALQSTFGREEDSTTTQSEPPSRTPSPPQLVSPDVSPPRPGRPRTPKPASDSRGRAAGTRAAAAAAGRDAPLSGLRRQAAPSRDTSPARAASWPAHAADSPFSSPRSISSARSASPIDTQRSQRARMASPMPSPPRSPRSDGSPPQHHRDAGMGKRRARRLVKQGSLTMVSPDSGERSDETVMLYQDRLEVIGSRPRGRIADAHTCYEAAQMRSLELTRDGFLLHMFPPRPTLQMEVPRVSDMAAWLLAFSETDFLRHGDNRRVRWPDLPSPRSDAGTGYVGQSILHKGDLQMQRSGTLVRMHCVLLPDRLQAFDLGSSMAGPSDTFWLEELIFLEDLGTGLVLKFTDQVLGFHAIRPGDSLAWYGALLRASHHAHKSSLRSITARRNQPVKATRSAQQRSNSRSESPRGRSAHITRSASGALRSTSSLAGRLSPAKETLGTARLPIVAPLDLAPLQASSAPSSPRTGCLKAVEVQSPRFGWPDQQQQQRPPARGSAAAAPTAGGGDRHAALSTVPSAPVLQRAAPVEAVPSRTIHEGIGRINPTRDFDRPPARNARLSSPR